MKNGLPTVRYCASELCLSPNYFGDLIRKETGKTAQEHIKLKTLDAIKHLLADRDKSITDIAYSLGFQYPQHLSRFFKKETGISPIEYRMKTSRTPNFTRRFRVMFSKRTSRLGKTPHPD